MQIITQEQLTSVLIQRWDKPHSVGPELHAMLDTMPERNW